MMNNRWIALLLALLLGLTCLVPALADEPAVSNELVINAADPAPEADALPQPKTPLLSLTLGIEPGATSAGGSAVLTATMSNAGSAVTGEALSIQLPVGLDLLFPELFDYNPATRIISLKMDLPTDATLSRAFDVIVSDAALPGSALTVFAYTSTLNTSATLTVVGGELKLNMSSTVRWAEPGDAVHYTVRLTNTGDAPITGLNVVNTVPDGMTINERTITGGGKVVGNTIVWTVDVPADDRVYLEFFGDIPMNAIEGDVFINVVTAAGLTATASVTVIEPEPILSITKKVNNRTPEPGTTVRYTIRVRNDGGGDAYDVRVIDTLPDDIEVERRTITDGGTYESRSHRIVWDVDVPAFETVTLTFRAYVPDSAEDGDIYVNRAHIRGGDSAKATLTVTEDAVPKTGEGFVAPAAWSIAPVSPDEHPDPSGDIVEVLLPPVVETFAELHETHPNLAGWLKVADQVDEPIAQADNNDFYMIRNFDGQDDEAGALFLDERNHLFPADRHLLIYGHNMKNGDRFGRLQEFRALDYLKSNPTFTFQSVYDAEPTTYVIVAVLDASMAPDHADYLKLRRPNFNDEADMTTFWQEVAGRSYFNIPVEVDATDALMTLVTCSYFQDDGRLLVVGRALRDGETAETIAPLMAEATAK